MAWQRKNEKWAQWTRLKTGDWRLAVRADALHLQLAVRLINQLIDSSTSTTR